MRRVHPTTTDLHNDKETPHLRILFKIGILYVKTNEYSIKHWKNVASIILISILTIIGFTSGIVTIVGIINKK
jgi:hypothetical protein